METREAKELLKDSHLGKRDYHSDSGASAAGDGTQDLIDATLSYARAKAKVMDGYLEVIKSEARLALMRFIAAVLGIIASVVLVLSAWVLIMVALAELIGQWLPVPGLNILLVALLNIAAALVIYLLSNRLLARAFAVRPFRGMTV